MKLRVYVLTGGCDGDRYVIGVYSSGEAAEKEKQKIIKTNSHYELYPDDLEVEGFILNARGEI